MKRVLIAFMALSAVMCCGKNNEETETPGKEVPKTAVPTFAKGADISWVTEMESKNYTFKTSAGIPMECTALMKEIGCNAVRYRVWVDPENGWCNKDDVLVKAKRAQALGLAIMIDFHYSDSWADPSKQTVPAAWSGMTALNMSQALAAHTKEVLNLLKDNGVDVSWVQVGNETNTGMCWPTGSVSSTETTGFTMLANSGYAAVKEVYPEALVLLHHSNAQKLNENVWFFNLVKGVRFDMIGLSLYPSYWDSSINGYPDWSTACKSAVSTFQSLHTSFDKPVMLVEFGMPASEPEKAKAALQYIMDNTSGFDWFKGVFYWEPESENSRNGYDYGAFSGGKPTVALDPFKN